MSALVSAQSGPSAEVAVTEKAAAGGCCYQLEAPVIIWRISWRSMEVRERLDMGEQGGQAELLKGSMAREVTGLIYQPSAMLGEFKLILLVMQHDAPKPADYQTTPEP